MDLIDMEAPVPGYVAPGAKPSAPRPMGARRTVVGRVADIGVEIVLDKAFVRFNLLRAGAPTIKAEAMIEAGQLSDLPFREDDEMRVTGVETLRSFGDAEFVVLRVMAAGPYADGVATLYRLPA